MPRRKGVKLRTVANDPKYGDQVISRFISCLVKEGKRSTAEHIFYSTIDEIKKRENTDPVGVFKKAMENVQPLIEVRSRRVGGANYQIPVEVGERRKIGLAIRWIIDGANGRQGKSMIEKLTGEILDAYRSQGSAIKKKDEVHRMAEANKAFAHYRW